MADLDADVVVVGAGIAGASAAWALAANHHVLLIEQEQQPGQHATGRSAALLNETSGTPTVCALATLSRPFFEDPPPGFVEHPLVAPRGLVWVGAPGDEAALDSLAATASRVRSTIRRVGPAELQVLVPPLRPERASVGGVHEPEARTVDVAALLQGYLRGLRARGGVVLTGAALLHGLRTPSGWVVRTSSGSLRCRELVNAAGAWGDEVAERCGVAALGLRVLRRTACIVPADESLARLPMVIDVGGRYYMEPEAGGLLLSPVDETPSPPCDARPEELDVARALERLAEATTLQPRHVRRAWAGLRTFAPDRAPVLGADPGAPGYWWLVGQGGAGIKTAPAMAAALAAVMAGERWQDSAGLLDLEASALSPARFR